MSLVAPLREARERLGLDADAARDPAALKRAYREAARRCPPDRDPEGFARARQAYEILSAPVDALRARLLHPAPFLAPPAVPARAPVKRGATALALLRVVAGSWTDDDAR